MPDAVAPLEAVLLSRNEPQESRVHEAHAALMRDYEPLDDSEAYLVAGPAVGPSEPREAEQKIIPESAFPSQVKMRIEQEQITTVRDMMRRILESTSDMSRFINGLERSGQITPAQADLGRRLQARLSGEHGDSFREDVKTMNAALGGLNSDLARTYALERLLANLEAGMNTEDAIKISIAEARERLGYAPEGFTFMQALALSLDNIIPSGKQFAFDLYDAVNSPEETFFGLVDIVTGYFCKGLGIESEKTVYADRVTEYYKGRFGSWSKFKEALAADPIGIAGDISIALTGGGALTVKGATVSVRMLKGSGSISKVAKSALSSVEKAGKAMATAGNALDPLTIPGKAVSGATKSVLPDPVKTVITEAGTLVSRSKNAAKIGAAAGGSQRAVERSHEEKEKKIIQADRELRKHWLLSVSVSSLLFDSLPGVSDRL